MDSDSFDRWRARLGAWLAPALFALMLLLPLTSLTPEAHKLAAVMAGVVVLWITEALPMPVTALLGAGLAILLGVAPAKDVLAPFADPLMFLFIGSFMLAQAIFIHKLDKRFAFQVLSLPWVGQNPSRILFVFGAVTAFISAWISNTATTAMMFAIGLSILRFFEDHQKQGGKALDPRYATGLMLMTSFSASIGGLATPIGTPPNLIGLGFIRKEMAVDMPFFSWCLVGVPLVLLLFLFTFVYMNHFCPAGTKEIAGSRAFLERAKKKLGPLSQAEKSVLLAFGLMVCLWVLPGVVAIVAGSGSDLYKFFNAHFPEAVAAILGAALLFVLPGDKTHPLPTPPLRGINSGGPSAPLDGRLPHEGEGVFSRPRVLTWEQAADIDWGVILLYGGGFALGTLSFQTGLASALGQGMTGWIPGGSGLGLLIASVLVAVGLSEVTSNTASANMVVPVVIAVAKQMNLDPLEPALAATMAASLGFMLPVSTPCNAIVYGSGLIPLTKMIRYGLILDIAGALVVGFLVHLITPFLR